jgi:hypothetical protein
MNHLTQVVQYKGESMRKIIEGIVVRNIKLLDLSELGEIRATIKKIIEIKERCEQYEIPYIVEESATGYFVEWEEGWPNIKFSLKNKDLDSILKEIEKEMKYRGKTIRKVIIHLFEFVKQENSSSNCGEDIEDCWRG